MVRICRIVVFPELQPFAYVALERVLSRRAPFAHPPFPVCRAQHGLRLLGRARAHADPAPLAEEPVDQPLAGGDEIP